MFTLCSTYPWSTWWLHHAVPVLPVHEWADHTLPKNSALSRKGFRRDCICQSRVVNVSMSIKVRSANAYWSEQVPCGPPHLLTQVGGQGCLCPVGFSAGPKRYQKAAQDLKVLQNILSSKRWNPARGAEAPQSPLGIGGKWVSGLQRTRLPEASGALGRCPGGATQISAEGGALGKRGSPQDGNLLYLTVEWCGPFLSPVLFFTMWCEIPEIQLLGTERAEINKFNFLCLFMFEFLV